MSGPLAPDRWRRVNELFLEAADRPAAERAAWLDAQCGADAELRAEVESLLVADASPEADVPVVRAVDAAIAAAAIAVPGAVTVVGPYRILREIGQGGMGTVFLAARADDEFQQRVAIKVVRGVPGADALRRFRAERQILASLEHPSIARLLDGGTTADGLPYFVMEYVEGLPIDRFCSGRQLSIRDRLALFCRVCDAVSHAHRSLVVHRDIKPANILVTEDGTPKLLDFGIAKLLAEDAPGGAPHTLTGLRALTPEYASPEQVRGDAITTASDVYSLGVLLFELLTGELPLAFQSRQPSEIERVVCNVEPRKPSAAGTTRRQSKELAGDLDTITLTALQKEPNRRYASAADLAEEVRRYLDGRPVVARPATWRYRSSRFVRRHRAAVGAAAIVVVLIVGFGVALGFQARRLARERDTADQVSNLLLELYSSYDPSESRGSTVTAPELLDRGAERIRAELTGRPETQARMLDAIGSLYSAIGLPDRAEAVLTESLAIRQAIGGDGSLDAARTLNSLANAIRERGRMAEAESLARRSLEIRRRLAGPRSVDTAESLTTHGVLLFLVGRAVDGAPQLVEALDIWRQTKGADSAEFASTLLSLARFWRERADYLTAEPFTRAELEIAERYERDRLAIRRKAFGDAHVLTTNSLAALGLILRATGRPAEAEPLMREVLALRRQVFGRDAHLSVVEAMNSLALVLQDLGARSEAESWYRTAMTLMRGLMPGHPQRAVDINNLGTLLEEMQRFDEAEAAFREAIDIRRRTLGADHPAVARTLNNAARLLRDRGRHAEALGMVDEALAIRRAAYGEAHFETVTSIVLRGTILSAMGRQAEAAPLVRNGLSQYRRVLPAGDPRIGDAERWLTGGVR